MALIIFRAQQPLLLFKVEKMATKDTFIKESGVGEKSISFLYVVVRKEPIQPNGRVCVCVCMYGDDDALSLSLSLSV